LIGQQTIKENSKMGETPKTSILFYSPSFPHYIAPLVNWQQRVRERHVREALKNYGEYLCTQLADQLSIHYELHKHPYKTFVLVRCAPRLAPGYPIWLSKLCPKVLCLSPSDCPTPFFYYTSYS
jgi:hypothetical protein